MYDVISVVSARSHFLLDAIFHREEFKSQGMSERAGEKRAMRDETKAVSQTGEGGTGRALRRRRRRDHHSKRPRGKRPLNFENSADAADAEEK